ncbi:hypothetical protein FH972_005034 [Carpinus fangiana]|uniref:Uncharacterized protein n=1 Tax=Carpinus fangiana TaxID=176857 RepID=A0A5N6QN03_9ROSI|nr:hypothetical protein FH972_005034 [Carpinus fangiana]
MGRSNEEKSTHNEGMHANKGQRIRKEQSRNRAGLQLVDEVGDEDCVQGRGMGEMELRGETHTSLKGLTDAGNIMGLENDTARMELGPVDDEGTGQVMKESVRREQIVPAKNVPVKHKRDAGSQHVGPEIEGLLSRPQSYLLHPTGWDH